MMRNALCLSSRRARGDAGEPVDRLPNTEGEGSSRHRSCCVARGLSGLQHTCHAIDADDDIIDRGELCERSLDLLSDQGGQQGASRVGT